MATKTRSIAGNKRTFFNHVNINFIDMQISQTKILSEQDKGDAYQYEIGLAACKITQILILKKNNTRNRLQLNLFPVRIRFILC